MVELSHVLALQSSAARLTAGTALLLGSQQGGRQRRGAAVAQVVQTIQGYLFRIERQRFNEGFIRKANNAIVPFCPVHAHKK